MLRSGIELFKPTGEVSSEDPQYIQIVSVNGIKRFARPCYSFGVVHAPSKEWLEKFSDQIQICVVYEKGDVKDPMWIGWTPLRGKLTGVEGFPKIRVTRTALFETFISDENNFFAVRQFKENGDLNQEILIKDSFITIQSESIFLVSANSTEPAVLGNKLEKDLQIEKARLDAVIQALSSSPTIPNDGGSAYKTAIAASLAAVPSATYSEIKSTKVKLT